MSQPVRVLMVHEAMSNNGSVRWANSLAKCLTADGLDVTIFSLLHWDDAAVPVPPNEDSVVYGGKPGERLRRAIPRSLTSLTCAVRQSDVVLVVSEVGWGLPLSYLIARVQARPFLVMVQSVLEESTRAWVPWRWRPLWLFCIRHADAVTVVSPGSIDSVLRAGVQAQRVTVIPPGADVVDIRARAVSAPAVRVSDGDPLLVAVGELVFRKGHDVLLRAMPAIRAEFPRARLVILGEGPERSKLEDLAEKLGIAGSVCLPGLVPCPYPDMLAADLLCLPSRYEAFGLVLLEALALGVPIIAADASGGGPRLLLDHGRYGVLVPPESSEALADAIIRNLREPQLSRERACAGLKQAEVFSPVASAESYLRIFRRVMRPGGRIRFTRLSRASLLRRR